MPRIHSAPDTSTRPHDLETEPRPQRLLLVASGGGHLAHLMSVRDWWQEYDRRWVTFNLPDTRARLAGEQVVWAHHPTTRNVKNLLRNMVVAARELHRHQPDVIVSTGAAAAVPFFLLGRLAGVPTVFIEVIDRFDSPTLTGRLCRPLATQFCVQLPEQLDVYPGARLIGPML